MEAFSHARRDDTVAVRILKRCPLPGGGILLPGERATVTPELAAELVALGLAECTTATPHKALDSPPRDTMVRQPTAKKGLA